MNDVPRIRLDELVLRYELEPGLADVYVEGSFDKEVLSRHTDAASGHTFYTIDAVDVPHEVLARFDLSEGAKQRVVALAKTLASAASGDRQYRCVVDRDLDHWFGAMQDVPNLFWTNHASLELYFFTRQILNDVLVITAKARIDSLDTLMSSMEEVLRHLYCMRLADHELRWRMEWIGFEKLLTFAGGVVTFDAEEYAERLLLKNGRSPSLATFRERIAYWRKATLGHPTESIRGHDFVSMLAWIIRTTKGIREFGATAAVERLLILLARDVATLKDLVL